MKAGVPEAMLQGAEAAEEVFKINFYCIKGRYISSYLPFFYLKQNSDFMRNILLPILLLLILGCNKNPDVEEPQPDYEPAILWGSSVWNDPGETKAAAYARVKAAFGTHEIVRHFSSGAAEWPTWLPKDANAHISFKYDAKGILAGTYDANLIQFFSGLSSTAKIYWTYFHEPEDDIRDGAFTAQEYRDAFDHIIDLQKTLNKPNLVPTLCLMSYSLTPESKRNWRDYLPSKVELLSWDGYYRDNMGNDVSKVFSAVRAIAVETGKPWAVAETGVNKAKQSGAINEMFPAETRKMLLTNLARDISQTNPKPVYVSYFDSDPPHDLTYSDWRISDDTSMVAAWNRGKFQP